MRFGWTFSSSPSDCGPSYGRSVLFLIRRARHGAVKAVCGEDNDDACVDMFTFTALMK